MKLNHSKSMNTLDVLMIAFGAMIGWGWVVSSGEWIKQAGVLGTALGFIIGGTMIYFVGLVYSELTTALPKEGVFGFCNHAYGHYIAGICMWILILSYVGVVCFEACSFATVIQYLFPGFMKGYLYTVSGFDIYASWLLLSIITCILIIVINVRGIKTAAVIQTILTIIIAGVGVLLIASSVLNGDMSNIHNQVFAKGTHQDIIKNTLSIAVVAPFFLFGFDVIPQAAEEINVPLKKLGNILVLSIILAVAFYTLVVFSIGYVMNSSQIEIEYKTTGLVAAKAMAVAFNSHNMAKVLILGGVCGILTSWNSFLIGGSRAIYSLSKSGLFPRRFSKIHPKYQTPQNAILLIGVLSIISTFFGRVMLTWVANVASFACCIAYFIVSISYIALRIKEPNMPRPFKIKYGTLVGIIASILSMMLCLLYIIPGTGCTLKPQEWKIIIVWLAIGIMMLLLKKRE